MKGYIFRIICAALFFGAVIGGMVYFSGTSPVIEQKGADIAFKAFTEGGKTAVELSSEKEEKFEEILLKAKRKNYKEKFAPVWQGDMKYEIYLIGENGHLFITLGNVNFAYKDASKGGYEIINAKEVIAEIDSLLLE